LLDRIKNAYPDNWQSILAESNLRAPMTLRVNLTHQTRDEYLAKLTHAGIEAKIVEGVQTAISLTSPQNVFELPGFSEGDSSVQDAAAQGASILLDCQDNMTVLDACAAPGGKTGHILESAKNLSVIAIDSSELRLKRVLENLDRLKLKATVITSDALETDNFAKNILFDRILLDAPCSATGVIRRHPDIKVLRRESDIKQLQQLQSDILDALWQKLKPSGVLLYATCSILPDENENQIKAFVERHDDAEILTIPKAQGLGRQVFPGEDGMDGFYYAKLSKIK
jgi:16S rRNA (cytosine967-C5)-methyltransferase